MGEDWEVVSRGHSGAVVRHSPDGRAYTKSGSGPLREDLEAERDRLDWLCSAGFPTARVLDWADDGDTATLTMSAVPGVPMSELPAPSVAGAVESLGRFLRRLHSSDRQSCPFERWLAVTVALARVRVEEGLVDGGDFDEERRGQSAEEALTRLLEDRPRAETLESGDLAICHGDACLPNFLIDPDTLAITGMIDVHRAGVADRHLDLALAVRSMSDTRLNPAYGEATAQTFLAAYGLPADLWRLDFYRLLDEFF